MPVNTAPLPDTAVPSGVLRRRTLLIGLVSSAVLVACGNAAATPPPAPPTVMPTTTAAPIPTAFPAAAATVAATPPASPTTSAPATTATRPTTAVVTVATPRAAASSAATVATPAGALRLNTLSPTELGAPAVPAAAVSAASNAKTYAQAIAGYPQYGTTEAPGVFPRTVKHAKGITTLRTAPQRVVVLGNGELDSVVDLGVTPVGTHKTDIAGRPANVQAAIQQAKAIGTQQEPDFEAIIALKPDLIIANGLSVDKFYDKLNTIAPTICGDGGGMVWKHNLTLYAQALGREREAAATFARYEARVRQLNAALPRPRPSVSVIRVMAGEVRYMWRANFMGLVLTEFGFPRPATQNIDDFGLTGQSLESLRENAPADLIVVSVDGGERTAHGQEFLNSPLWQSLEAVKAGKFLLAPQGTWINGLSLPSALSVMDDLTRYFNIAA